MAFLSKILFKPNKVLEILSSVCIYYIFKCKTVHLRHVSRQPDVHYSSLLNED